MDYFCRFACSFLLLRCYKNNTPVLGPFLSGQQRSGLLSCALEWFLVHAFISLKTFGCESG